MKLGKRSYKRKTLCLPIKAQPAKPEDIVQIVSFAFATFKEVIGNFPYTPDYDKTLFSFIKYVNEGHTYVIQDLKNPKYINGVLALAKDAPYWSTQPVLSSTLFYLKPGHRNFKNAKALIHEAQKCSIIEGIPLVFDFFAQKDADRKKTLLRYLGFEDYGSCMVFIPPKL